MQYKINQSVRKIKCPVICITDDKRLEFDNGIDAAEYTFDKYYIVDFVTAENDRIIIQLVENKDVNNISWTEEEAGSFF